MAEIYAVANDDGKVVGVVLSADGSVVDLDGQSLECHLHNASSDTTIEITGLSGTALGAVSTAIVNTNLIEGRWTMEWQVVGGLTYPSNASSRHVLVVRPEVS